MISSLFLVWLEYVGMVKFIFTMLVFAIRWIQKYPAHKQSVYLDLNKFC